MCTACLSEAGPARSLAGTPAAAAAWCRARSSRGQSNLARSSLGRSSLAPASCASSYRPEQSARPARAPGRAALRPLESSARAFEQELREQAHAHRRRSLGMARAFAFEIRGARDVEMHPGEAVDEFAEKPCAGDGAGRAAARVLDVGGVGLEEIAVLVPQRQRPATLAGALAGVADFIEQRSEEHTSELQSHSFISYAVFCLKKK